MRVFCFPPIESTDAVILILGSMPSVASLNARQYYAHPQNLFWRFMGELFGAGPQLPYAERVAILKAQHVAVWDVLKACVRVGSADAAIDRVSEEPNDFHAFFAAHPRIRKIFFNGSKAEHAFRKHIAAQLHGLPATFECVRLPSTSPANASIPLQKKLEAWSKIASTR